MLEAGVRWRTLGRDDLGDEFDENEQYEEGVDCEVVTFGHYLSNRGYHLIPRQFLRPATMKDLVQRLGEIQGVVFRRAWDPRYDGELEDRDLLECLIEQTYIIEEIQERERMARRPSKRRNVFLCHASADKPFVRCVMNDLARAGHTVWLDEFEINVGDSIVQKISGASAEADALVLFASKSAMASEWVSREWSSALARMLGGDKTRVLPALIEDCSLPAILVDIKYADFRTSYADGLSDLLKSLGGAVRRRR